jgi:4-aminobutyrate aminotransferase-like enzyme/Ser/Thr protein kinase RdoA (MazF antagonist)
MEQTALRIQADCGLLCAMNPEPISEYNPTFSNSEAARLAAELYGLTASAKRLPGEYDHNFHLTTNDGAEFVLKVMHAERERALIELQCHALAHLAKRAPALVLPRVCATQDGEWIATTSANGQEHFVWLLSYVPGALLAKVNPHTPELLVSLGQVLGQVNTALTDFNHSAAAREMKWDLARASWVKEYIHCIEDDAHCALIERLLQRYETEVVPALPTLRKSVIHNDANDYNVIINEAKARPREAISVIDFGDMLHTCTVFEVAIAAAYALLDKPDPLASAANVIAGYHQFHPLTESEIALLFDLICSRLMVSVVNSAHRKRLHPDDPYITISERPAWEAIEKLAKIPAAFAHYTFRNACGLSPVPQSERVVNWLQANAANFASVLDEDLRASRVFDLSVGSLWLGADPAAFERDTLTESIFRAIKQSRARVGVGRYDEARSVYTTPAFASGDGIHPTAEHRTIHLGIDLFIAAGANVHAPLDGIVHCVANNDTRLDYGPLLILKHATDDGQEFFTLYGHLSEEHLTTLQVGQAIQRGQHIANIGAPPTNGDWTPHLHFQLITDLLELDRDFPGVAYASQREVWKSLSPDPNLILSIPADRFPLPEQSKSETLVARYQHIGHNLSISYREPLKMVRGWRQYLYDETGGAYLDVYNNVPLVGHSHPRVVKAAQQQLALLNTNTRYLHDNITRYAEALTALMPAPLSVCYFLNSASEANELALRLARAHTKRYDIIVLDAAYHGHTTALIDISPYKFNGPGGTGKKDWVHIAPIPDDYRGEYKRGDAEAGRKYANHVAEIIANLPSGFAAYIAETLPSVGGQIVFPPGYLSNVYKSVRDAGGVCIADEVQVGFGRLGTHFWGFETQDVVPDIVVLGKPIGNAFPLAAVVTTPDIAASFDNGMEFFSTFGGNPVACAVGLTVLDVLRDEKLQFNALQVGNHWLQALRGLRHQHVIIGDVRGSGLFLGIELVRDRMMLEPADIEADYIVNRLRARGILAGIDGPLHNVIKLRPPLVFTQEDADFFVRTLDQILCEDAVQIEK